jgi:Fur family ferric uptake transcriptional regulator
MGFMSTREGAPTSRVELALTLLQARHERVTPARVAVLEILEATRDHLNADEIVSLAAVRAPGVHRATIYRALATLGSLGLVTHTHVGGSAAVYHLLLPDAGGDPTPTHAHVQCTACGTVLDIPVDALQPLASRLQNDLDFRLDPEHTALLGTCSACKSR